MPKFPVSGATAKPRLHNRIISFYLIKTLYFCFRFPPREGINRQILIWMTSYNVRFSEQSRFSAINFQTRNLIYLNRFNTPILRLEDGSISGVSASLAIIKKPAYLRKSGPKSPQKETQLSTEIFLAKKPNYLRKFWGQFGQNAVFSAKKPNYLRKFLENRAKETQLSTEKKETQLSTEILQKKPNYLRKFFVKSLRKFGFWKPANGLVFYIKSWVTFLCFNYVNS